MIPHYRRKRNIGDHQINNIDPPIAHGEDGTNLTPENLTRNPQLQILFTADTTVVDGNILYDTESLHPVVKYGIPIGAMFLLGLFLYATFSKRWNKKAAVTTDSVESMKLNTTRTIDSLAEYVNSQIKSAENTVLDHVRGKIGSTSEGIIRDMSVQSLATEGELISGLKKAIAQQEIILIDNIRRIFEQARLYVTKEVRDEFSTVEESMEQLFREHNQEGDEENNTVFNAAMGAENLSTELSNIQKNISITIRRRISKSQDALLLLTEKQIIHMTNILNNIIPKDMQASDQTWNRTNYRIEDMKKSLIEKVRTTIVCTEENMVEYIKNEINEVKRIAIIENQLKPVEKLKNDIKVDIKQPGKSSFNGNLDSIQNINEKKSTGITPIKKPPRKMGTNAENDFIEETNIVSETDNVKTQLQEQNICSRCAAEKLFEKTNKTVAIEIIEKSDIMNEMKQKKENVSNTSILEEKKRESKEEVNHMDSSVIASSTVVHSPDETIDEVHEKEKPTEISTEQSAGNYSVREQAENSIKLWLARFKQAVPHLPDNLHSFSKYDKSQRSIEKILNHPQKEKDIQAENSKDLNNQVLMNEKEPSDLIDDQDYNRKESPLLNQEQEIQLDETHKLRWVKANALTGETKLGEEVTTLSNMIVGNVFAERETTVVEIHQHPDENRQNVQEEKLKFSKPLLDIEEEISKEIELNNVENSPLEEAPRLDDQKEIDKKKVDDSERESIPENLQAEAEKNNSKITDSTLDSDKESESVARSTRNWLKEDEIIEGEDESWPSHLPKIVLTSIEKENHGKESIMSEESKGGEDRKIHVFSEFQNDEEQKIEVRAKEWLEEEETKVNSALPHEEIMKICGAKIQGSNEKVELETNVKSREKILRVTEIPESNEELCSDYLTGLGFSTSSTILQNTMKKAMEPQIAVEEHLLPYGEGQKETNIDTRNGEKSEINTNKEQEMEKALELEPEERQIEDVDSSNNRKWLDIDTEIHDDKEKFSFDNKEFRKESIASTSSEVSFSSNESTSNEISRKEEEPDIMPVLKLPNMDNKLRKKRRINRRQLKSLDSGVHHYYGEYISIEFPINDLDEEADQKESFNETNQSTELEMHQETDQKLSHIPSTSKEQENDNVKNINNKDDIDLPKIEDEGKADPEKVAFELQGQTDA